MINEEYYSRLAQVESSSNPKAKNPKSSAKGLYQFIDSTAKQYGITAPFGTPEYLRQETKAVKKFTADNYNSLKQGLNREPTEGELYLAHQQGAGGALKILSQDQNKKAVDVLGEDEVLLNGGNKDMTLAEFSQKWTSKFDQEPVKTVETKTTETNDSIVAAVELPQVNLYDMMDAETGDIVKKEGINLYELMAEQDNADEFLQKDDKKQRIDHKSGAPSYIRSIVGSVYDQEDRLGTLQKYYPDAKPYGEDNFVFTNPENGQPTLYNPKGLDWGDAASIAREAFVTVGSGLGAGAGIAASVPTGGTATIPMAMVGAGQGAFVSGQAYDRMMSMFGFTQDTRSFQQKVSDYAIETAAAGIGEGVGRAALPAIKRGLGGAKQTSQNIVNSFKEFGIRPSAPAVTGGKGVARFEAGLAQVPSAAGVIEKQTDQIIDQTQKAVSKVVQQYGKPASIQETGATIKEATKKAAERIGFKQEELYQQAYDAMGTGARVQVGTVKELYNNMISEASKAPETLAPKLKPAINELNAILADAGDEGIDFQALRQIRTSIGQDLSKSFLSSGSEEAAKKRIYAAISEDLGNAASQVSPEAANMIKKADRYTRIYENQYKKYIAKIIETDAEEKAYRFAMSSSQYGGTTLNKLKNMFEPDEWDMVSASVLDKIGLATKGMQNAQGDAFSINTFMTNWNKLSPEAKKVLFNTPRHKETYQSLNRLTEVMDKLKEAGRSTNTSNTAGALNTMVMMQGLGGGMLAMASGGDVTGVAGTMIGTVVAPRVGAKLLTSPKFVEWLATPVEQGISSMPSHISRLVAIGESDETLKEPIREYLEVLNANTRQEE